MQPWCTHQILGKGLSTRWREIAHGWVPSGFGWHHPRFVSSPQSPASMLFLVPWVRIGGTDIISRISWDVSKYSLEQLCEHWSLLYSGIQKHPSLFTSCVIIIWIFRQTLQFGVDIRFINRQFFFSLSQPFIRVVMLLSWWHCSLERWSGSLSLPAVMWGCPCVIFRLFPKCTAWGWYPGGFVVCWLNERVIRA